MSGVSGGGSPTPIAATVIASQLGAKQTVRAGRRGLGMIVWWVVFLAGVAYFLIPLWSTFTFSLRAEPFGSAYTNTLDDPQFGKTLLYSFVVGVITVVVSIGLLVPTAFWVRLRVPRLRRIVEFITLLPFVIPPILLVFGLIRSYSTGPLPLTNTDIGSSALLVAAYTVVSFPYMYRAVDVGLRSIDVQSLTEASQSLGAGWLRILWSVILPNLRVSLIAGAFLTLAIVIGEFTIATFLARPAFGPYLALIGGNKAYEPAAVSLVSFVLTWIAMGVIQYIGRGTRVSVAGAR
jgi:putative spermidine/putrescine transport system permease protein